jgi:hypothetical protein
MRFRILGGVADEGGRGLVLGGRRQRSVLVILLLHANKVVARAGELERARACCEEALGLARETDTRSDRRRMDQPRARREPRATKPGCE